MNYKLQDLIDLEQFQVLQDRLNQIYSFPSAIIDNDGNILTATAWQDICTQFHRQNHECLQDCIKSDRYILSHLHEANPAVTYHCPHGLVDNATPIIIDGIHYGNYFTGQFFLNTPDPDFFRAQAKRYGFDEKAYLAAMWKVPIWTQTQLENYLFFIKGLITVISESGLKRLRELEHRKQIEDTECRANAILHTAMDGFWRVDIKGRLLEVNEAYCRMSGYDQESLLKMYISDLEAAESPADIGTHLQRVFEKGLDQFETKHRRKDGSLFDVEVSVQLLSGMNGCFVAFLHDITKRKRAEVLLKARAELTELAQHASLDELVQVALDKAELLTRSCIGFFHFVEKDQECLRMQQWSTNTIQNMCTAEGKGRHYPVSEAGVWGDCLRTGKPVIHNDYAALPHRKGLPPGHAPVIRELVVPVMRDGLAVAILAVGNKATEYTSEDVSLVEQLAGIVVDNALRKQAEDTARESKEILQTVFENSPIGLEVYDRSGLLISCNRRVGELFGANTDSFIGKFNLFDDPQYRNESDLERLRKGEEVRSEIFCDFSKVHFESTRSGSAHLDMIATPVPQSTSDHIGFIRQIIDVTEQKRLQEQLRQVQKLDAIGQLAGGVAHDFNNVLATMMLHLFILQQKPELDLETQQSLEELKSETERAANLTRQLLLFSSRAVIDVKPLNLNEVVANLLKMLGRLIGEHIDLKFIRHAGLPMVKADPGMMEQVIMNLCVNARDAMPGGGKLTIGLELVQVDEARAQQYAQARVGEYVCLSVADTGSGMDESTVEHIFEPFFTTKEIGRGTGLGLATVHGIVNQHGGWVEVESVVGQGSKFYVFIPAIPSKSDSLEAMKTKVAVGEQETILLVEDEANLRKITALSLRRIGYQVLEAVNGAEALEVWANSSAKIDLLMSDMVMPGGMTGLELTNKLREKNPNLKVIIVSGYSSEGIPKDLIASRQIVTVQKPYQLESLSIVIRECLNRK
jgi:two-component system, cell cycle sensor histidine kinase and response regulator CckA